MSDARPFSPTPGFQVFFDEFRLRKAGLNKSRRENSRGRGRGMDPDAEAEMLAQAQREWASRTSDPIGGQRWADQYEGEAKRRLAAPGGGEVGGEANIAQGQAAPVPLKSQSGGINRESVGQFGSKPSLIERSADALLKQRFGGPAKTAEGPFSNDKIEAPSMALLPAKNASEPAPVALRSQQPSMPKARPQLTPAEVAAGASVSYEPKGPVGTASYTDRLGNEAGSDAEGEFATVQGRRLRGADYAKYTQTKRGLVKDYDSAVADGGGNYEEGKFQQAYSANLKAATPANARTMVATAADRAPGMPGARASASQDSEQFRARLTPPRAVAGRRNRNAVAL